MRVRLGAVDEHGVGLADGNTASAGDWVVTDVGRRTLITCGGRDFVKAGDPWTVVERHPDDSLTVGHQRHRGRLTLPADYVRGHVRLAYALTPGCSRSVSVETSHPVVGRQTTRDDLYLAATRGRQATTLYLGIQDATDPTPGRAASARDARRLLASVLARRSTGAATDRVDLGEGDRYGDRLQAVGAGVRSRQRIAL